MSRRARMIAIAVTVAVLVLLALVIGSDQNDPVYKGRRLSSWFMQYALANNAGRMSGTGDESAGEALAAMRALGTNALPWLVGQAFANEPSGPFGSNRVVWLHSQPLPLLGQILKLPRLVPRIQLCEEAVKVVGQLQVPADALLHLLGDELAGTNEVYQRVSLLMLGGAREEAEKVVPYLVRALGGTNLHMGIAAVTALEHIAPAGKGAIPSLIDRLRAGPPNTLREIALLGNYGPDAAAAVPQLERLMRSHNQNSVRAQASVALGQICGNHSEALAIIRGALLGPQNRTGGAKFITQPEAFLALSRATGFGEAFVPALIELAEQERIESSDNYASTRSLSILTRMATNEAAKVLGTWMREDPHAFVRAYSAQQLLVLQRHNDEAVIVLSQMIQTNLANKAYLLSYLGEASPQSKLALDTLKSVAATNEHPALRDTARQTLERIRRRGELTSQESPR